MRPLPSWLVPYTRKQPAPQKATGSQDVRSPTTDEELIPTLSWDDSAPEALKKVTREVCRALVTYIHARTAFGERKYGQRLATFDGRDTKQEILEELTDALQYLQKFMLEIDVLHPVDKPTPDMVEITYEWAAETRDIISRQTIKLLMIIKAESEKTNAGN